MFLALLARLSSTPLCRAIICKLDQWDWVSVVAQRDVLLAFWNRTQVDNTQHREVCADIPASARDAERVVYFVLVDDQGWAIQAKPTKVASRHHRIGHLLAAPCGNEIRRVGLLQRAAATRARTGLATQRQHEHFTLDAEIN